MKHIKENIQALAWPLSPWILMIILTWLLSSGDTSKAVSRPVTKAQQDSTEVHYYRDKEFEAEQVVR